MKILAFCSDLLPFPGLATSGGGLRSWQLVQSLRALGHDVIASMPMFTFLSRQFADRVPPEIVANAWDRENQDSLVELHQPDAILFTSTWIVDCLEHRPDCPLIYDLHGPQLLEQHYKRERNTPHNLQAKIERLSKADFVICAGERQRLYFLPFLLMAGYAVEDLDRGLAVVPIACDPQLPVHEFPKELEVVMGGGFFPWQDSTVAMLAIKEVLSSSIGQRTRFRIFGGSHGITGDDDVRFNQLRAELAHLPNVTFEGYVPHDRLIEIYRKASLALDVHARNPERELAITTRTVEYLWSGLPVIHDDFSEMAGWIRQYDAGWTVDPCNPSCVCQALSDALSSPSTLAATGQNAQSLVRDRFIHSQAIEPLAEYLRSPRRREKKGAMRVVTPTRHEELSRIEAEYFEVLRSRTFQAVNQMSAWSRRFWSMTG